MESYSIFYTAAHSIRPKPIPFIIKSVSDFGDSNKNTPDKDAKQEYAAYTSANFLYYFVINCINYN